MRELHLHGLKPQKLWAKSAIAPWTYFFPVFGHDDKDMNISQLNVLSVAFIIDTRDIKGLSFPQIFLCKIKELEHNTKDN